MTKLIRHSDHVVVVKEEILFCYLIHSGILSVRTTESSSLLTQLRDLFRAHVMDHHHGRDAVQIQL